MDLLEIDLCSTVVELYFLHFYVEWKFLFSLDLHPHFIQHNHFVNFQAIRWSAPSILSSLWNLQRSLLLINYEHRTFSYSVKSTEMKRKLLRFQLNRQQQLFAPNWFSIQTFVWFYMESGKWTLFWSKNIHTTLYNMQKWACATFTRNITPHVAVVYHSHTQFDNLTKRQKNAFENHQK